MTAIGIIAALTMREALRRRLVAALGVICLALVALGGWGFYRLSHNSAMTSGEVDGALPQAFVLFMFMFSFVVALSASAIASPSVSAEIESGVLQTVVTRPVRRGGTSFSASGSAWRPSWPPTPPPWSASRWRSSTR